MAGSQGTRRDLQSISIHVMKPSWLHASVETQQRYYIRKAQRNEVLLAASTAIRAQRIAEIQHRRMVPKIRCREDNGRVHACRGSTANQDAYLDLRQARSKKTYTPMSDVDVDQNESVKNC